MVAWIPPCFTTWVRSWAYRIRENGTRRLASGYLPENVDDAIGASSAGWKRDAVFEPGWQVLASLSLCSFGVGMWAANLHALPADAFPKPVGRNDSWDSWVRRGDWWRFVQHTGRNAEYKGTVLGGVRITRDAASRSALPRFGCGCGKGIEERHSDGEQPVRKHNTCAADPGFPHCAIGWRWGRGRDRGE